MSEEPGTTPDWDHLFEVAVAQDGMFTTRQAAEVGYSPQLLAHYLASGRIVRVRRGVYRIVHYPAGEHEELTVIWLWSERAGVFSHQTALALHNLSDALPAQAHLTLPREWKKRRFRVPEGVVLHWADVPSEEMSWFGSVPVTAPARTLNDCAQAAISPELLRQAAFDALHRGLVTKDQLTAVLEALKPYGGLGS